MLQLHFHRGRNGLALKIRLAKAEVMHFHHHGSRLRCFGTLTHTPAWIKPHCAGTKPINSTHATVQTVLRRSQPCSSSAVIWKRLNYLAFIQRSRRTRATTCSIIHLRTLAHSIHPCCTFGKKESSTLMKAAEWTINDR